MKRLISLMLILTLAGCTPRSDLAGGQPRHFVGGSNAPANFGDSEEETVVLLLLDLSGSFADRMANSGEGYKFACAVIDKYFRNKAGTQDKLVIAQISGSDKSLLFEGTPMDLRRTFSTPDAFRDFLMKKADSSGSKVHKSINHSMKYVLSDRRVLDNNKSRVAVFVLSDMLDSSNDSLEEGYMNHEISVLGLRGGVMGVYFADSDQSVRWRAKLSALGVRNFVVMGEVAGTPTLPSFEE